MKNIKSRFYSAITVLSSFSIAGAAMSNLGGICFSCKSFTFHAIRYRLYTYSIAVYIYLNKFQPKFTGYRGRILEWGVTGVISILMLLCNIFILILTIIPICFTHRRRDAEKVKTIILNCSINYLLLNVFL